METAPRLVDVVQSKGTPDRQPPPRPLALYRAVNNGGEENNEKNDNNVYMKYLWAGISNGPGRRQQQRADVMIGYLCEMVSGDYCLQQALIEQTAAKS